MTHVNPAAARSPVGIATLKQRVLRAGSWNVAGYGIGLVIRLGGNLVMTRLLVPEMFGIMAIAGMVRTICALLSDLGLQQNIVQSRRGDQPEFLDTAWVVQILRGLILWAAALLVSVALYVANRAGIFASQSVYASPLLALVIAVGSFSAVIEGLQSTKLATALRDLDQKPLIQIGLIGQCAGLGVMILGGILTRSIWALVAGGLVASLTTTVLSHTSVVGHSNRWRWDRESLGELLGFGKWVFLSSAIGVFASNGDRLLLGVYVDARTLGLYAIASLIVGTAHGALSRLFAAVWLPVLSEVARNDPSRLREIYYKLRVPSDLLLLFASGALFISGPCVIHILYDARYAEAGSMLQILAVSLFAIRYGVTHQVYLALGLPRNVMVVNTVRFISLYAMVPVLFRIAGQNGAIWGIALYALASIPIDYYFAAKLRLNDYRRELLVLAAFPLGVLCGLLVIFICR